MALRDRFGQVDPDAVRTLLVGDLLAICTFLVVGELEHGFNPVEVPVRVALVALPFLAGWVVFGSLAGAYSADLLDSPRDLLATAFLGWLLADAAGQALRSTAAIPGDASPVFFAVAFGVGFLLLAVWRGVRALVRRVGA